MILGINQKELSNVSLLEKCPGCGSEYSLRLSIFQEYVEVLWIPCVPAGKNAVCKCDNCKQKWSGLKLPKVIREAASQQKSRNKTPIWTYTGVGLIFLSLVIDIIIELIRENRHG